MRTLALLLTAVLASSVAACGADDVASSGPASGHGASWKRADLDRNRLDLAQHRGAETGAELARWVRNGLVVASSGTSPSTVGGDAEVVVRYTAPASEGIGGDDGYTDCYLFRFPDGYSAAFDLVDCP